MISAGHIIEYLDNGKFICALVSNAQAKRLSLINQNGREVKLPLSRVIHHSLRQANTDNSREQIINLLQETAERRQSLVKEINLQEIWELVKDEPASLFEPAFLAELSFGKDASDNTISAFLRSILADRLYFKFKDGKAKAHTEQQVTQLLQQQEKEARKKQLIANSSAALVQLMAGEHLPDSSWQDKEECLGILRDFYLFGNEAENAEVARLLLKQAKLSRPHDPFHILVKAGFWTENENIPLLRQELPINFSVEARKQAETILQQGTKDLHDDPNRKDFTHLAAMTIDGATTRDFDDAITLEEQDGNYLVGIHISDVAHYVKPDDPLFLEAMHRGTSLYFPEGQIPMLPSHLSQGICSLIEGEERAVISFMILLSPEAEVLRFRPVQSIIKVKRRLTYDEADQMIETDSELKILKRLKDKLLDKRLKADALLLPFPDVNIFLAPQGEVKISLSDTDTPSRSLIAELMILTNTETARHIADKMVPGLFRSQGPPRKRVVFGTDKDLYANTLQRKNLSRGELLTQAKPHSGLGVSHYTTVTSPIRRLLDLVIQHQLHSIISREEPCFSEDGCKDFTAVISRTLARANNVKQQRHRYWLLKYLENRKGSTLEALVINSGNKRVFLLLTDILMDIDLPTPPGDKPQPGSTVQVKLSRVNAMDNLVRFEW